MTLEPIGKLLQRLAKAWCQETAYHGRKGWTPENPAWGQCAATALVIRSLHGGHLLRSVARTPSGDTIPHYFNMVPDHGVIDATRIQFPSGTTFSTPKRHSPSGRDVKRRAEILMRRLNLPTRDAALAEKLGSKTP